MRALGWSEGTRGKALGGRGGGGSRSEIEEWRGNLPQGHEYEGVGSRVYNPCAGLTSLLALVKIRTHRV